MTIEFSCPQCSQIVRTPDGAAGKKGKCPGCQAVVQIPAAQKPAPAAAQQTTAEDAGPIEFFCTFCGSVVRTPRATGGKKGKCPHCSEVVQIPLISPPKPAAKPAATKPATAPKPATPTSTTTTPKKSAAPTAAATKPATPKPAASSSAAPTLQPLTPLTPLSAGADLFGEPVAKPQPTKSTSTPAPALAPLMPLGGSSGSVGGDLFGGPPVTNRATQPLAPLAPLTPLGSGPVGGDLFGGAPLPAKNTSNNPFGDAPVSHPPAASALFQEGAMRIPAIIQLVAVIPFLFFYLFYFGLCLLSLVFSSFTVAAVNSQYRSIAMNGFLYNAMWAVLTLLFIVGQVVIIFGSVRQLERKGLLMAQIGAWLSVIPCVSPMGMPAGIWSLIGLYRDETKRSFRS